MAKKPEISLTYRILNELDITVRFLGKVARLGESGIKANWAYEIKLGGTRLFSGADLYTDSGLTHSEAAGEVLWLHMPSADGVPSWFDVSKLKRTQMAWFLTDYRRFFKMSADHMNVAHMPDAFFVRGDGSAVPMSDFGQPVDDSTLGGLSGHTEQLIDAVEG